MSPSHSSGKNAAVKEPRLAAVRRQVLARMYEKTVGWRLGWFVPFNVVVFGMLWARHTPPLCVTLQLSTLVVCVVFALGRFRTSAWPFVWHAVHFFVGATITGALESPLLPMGLPIVAGAVVVLESKRAKWLVAAVFLAGAVELGVAEALGARALLLPTTSDWIVAAGAVAYTVVALVRLGLDVEGAYTELALELAARREEVFSEGEDHARSLEGVAARLAHEVKNPLAAIKGLSVHMAKGAGDPKTAERLAIVAQEADRLQAIVDGFLGFTRGLDDLRLATVVPYDVARELVVLLETRADEAGVSVEVVGDERAEVVADARKLRQALLNVVLNAMQASARGGSVTISIARGAPDMLRVRVVDHGSGMTPAVLERIRKPYFTTRAGGSGLGVAIARALVEQHGGSMSIESTEGKGTTVTIELRAEGPAVATKLPDLRAASGAEA
jgi:signal transduction histidine kinase